MSSETTTPIFSVVVASHGRAALLERLLDSIAGCRTQSGPIIEILVIDSTHRAHRPAIQAACRRFDCSLIDGELSVRQKRNLGARTATGEWLLFIDSDCEASAGLFDAYRNAFWVDPTLQIAAGPTIFQGGETTFTRLIANSSLFAPFRHPATRSRHILWATTSNLLIRRTAFESVGGFCEDFPFRLGGDDTDLCLRLRDAGHHVVAVPQATCHHSWNTWNSPISVARRSFRWGWMHALLLRKHPTYRRLDAPGLAIHTILCLLISIVAAVHGKWLLLAMPLVFVLVAISLHAVFISAGARKPWRAFVEDIALAFVELPFGFGRVLGSLASGSFVGVLYRLDTNDIAMDSGFPETVRSLWCDHLSFMAIAILIGWTI